MLAIITEWARKVEAKTVPISTIGTFVRILRNRVSIVIRPLDPVFKRLSAIQIFHNNCHLMQLGEGVDGYTAEMFC
jgi:hypothetical protein